LYNDDEDAHDFTPAGEVNTKKSNNKIKLGDIDRQTDLNEPLTDKNMEVSMVSIHGTGQQQ